MDLSVGGGGGRFYCWQIVGEKDSKCNFEYFKINLEYPMRLEAT